ncbi:tripartite motif-containing protein 2-like [Amphiura filiformis]|uniref:tripartite motif-containing protein 2-like n=1 Tax=Amphiura filiformis TaxID=82378 RepID=UPI003B20F8C2
MAYRYLSFADTAQEDLECPVCSELLRAPNTPKLLDCMHECCVLCIKKIIEGGRREVECPECRRKTCIPDEGVEAMKTNRRIRNLAEKHEGHRKIKAKACNEHGIAIDYYCKKCNISGCSTCMMELHQGPDHDAVKIDDILKDRRDEIHVSIQTAEDVIEGCKLSRNQLESVRKEIADNIQIQCKNMDTETKKAIMKLNEEKT